MAKRLEFIHVNFTRPRLMLDLLQLNSVYGGQKVSHRVSLDFLLSPTSDASRNVQRRQRPLQLGIYYGLTLVVHSPFPNPAWLYIWLSDCLTIRLSDYLTIWLSDYSYLLVCLQVWLTSYGYVAGCLTCPNDNSRLAPAIVVLRHTPPS